MVERLVTTMHTVRLHTYICNSEMQGKKKSISLTSTEPPFSKANIHGGIWLGNFYIPEFFGQIGYIGNLVHKQKAVQVQSVILQR